MRALGGALPCQVCLHASLVRYMSVCKCMVMPSLQHPLVLTVGFPACMPCVLKIFLEKRSIAAPFVLKAASFLLQVPHAVASIRHTLRLHW